MDDGDRIRDGLTAALSGAGRGRAAADRLCSACVDLLDVDGAALSIIYDGAISRSLGASGQLSRELDELQFTLGEGPCLQAVTQWSPVLVADLDDPTETLWPGFAGAALQRGVRAVFALPVSAAASAIGALDLYRHKPGELGDLALAGGLIAAELAALPLLDLMGIDLEAAMTDETSGAWEQLTQLTRVEVYQAAGMLIGQLNLSPAEALIRLRAYAYANDLTASDVAYAIIEDGLLLADDEGRASKPATGGSE
ncbi:GAF and ANTAR domain-containing protein [Jatrophihabitans sp. DSM 45814]